MPRTRSGEDERRRVAAALTDASSIRHSKTEGSGPPLPLRIFGDRRPWRKGNGASRRRTPTGARSSPEANTSRRSPGTAGSGKSLALASCFGALLLGVEGDPFNTGLLRHGCQGPSKFHGRSSRSDALFGQLLELLEIARTPTLPMIRRRLRHISSFPLVRSKLEIASYNRTTTP